MVPQIGNFFPSTTLGRRVRLTGASGARFRQLNRPSGPYVREGFLSTSQAVAQHLPYLRRYARALSGNQASGDAYVAAALEALIQDPKVLDSTSSTDRKSTRLNSSHL